MRFVAIGVLISMCHVPAAFAGETLRQAAAREADRLAAAQAAAARAIGTAAIETRAIVRKPPRKKSSASFQQTPPGLEGASGLGRRTKILLGAGVAAALAGIMLSIDGQVEDNTPSTKGERTNEPF